jgi:hypothetical protein
MERTQDRIDKEKQFRRDENLKCMKMCDTMRKAKQIENQVEKDSDEFGYNVLHKGLY